MFLQELDHKKRDYNDLQGECEFLKEQLKYRDELIEVGSISNIQLG